MFSSLLFFLENFVWFWMAVFLPINSATKWGQTQDNRKFLGKCLPSQMFPHNKSMCNPTYSIYTHSQWQNECVSERDRKTKDLYSSWANTDRTYRKTGKPDTPCGMWVCVCAFEACLPFKWTSGCYLLSSIFPASHRIHELIPLHMNAFRFERWTSQHRTDRFGGFNGWTSQRTQ